MTRSPGAAKRTQEVQQAPDEKHDVDRSCERRRSLRPDLASEDDDIEEDEEAEEDSGLQGASPRRGRPMRRRFFGVMASGMCCVHTL